MDECISFETQRLSRKLDKNSRNIAGIVNATVLSPLERRKIESI